MRYRSGQVNVSKPLSTHLGWDNFYTTFLTDNPAVFHTLIFAAITLVILSRTEDFSAEEAVTLRLEGTVVYCLRFLHFSERTLSYLLRRRDGDTYC